MSLSSAAPSAFYPFPSIRCHLKHLFLLRLAWLLSVGEAITPLPALPSPMLQISAFAIALQWPVCPSMSFSSGTQPAWGIGLFFHQWHLYCLPQYQLHKGTQYILVHQINKIKIRCTHGNNGLQVVRMQVMDFVF